MYTETSRCSWEWKKLVCHDHRFSYVDRGVCTTSMPVKMTVILVAFRRTNHITTTESSLGFKNSRDQAIAFSRLMKDSTPDRALLCYRLYDEHHRGAGRKGFWCSSTYRANFHRGLCENAYIDFVRANVSKEGARLEYILHYSKLSMYHSQCMPSPSLVLRPKKILYPLMWDLA